MAVPLVVQEEAFRHVAVPKPNDPIALPSTFDKLAGIRPVTVQRQRAPSVGRAVPTLAGPDGLHAGAEEAQRGRIRVEPHVALRR